MSRTRSPENINIKQLMRRIKEAGPIKEQKSEARAILPGIKTACELLQKKAESICDRFKDQYARRTDGNPPKVAEPFMMRSEHYIAIVLFVGAFVAMALDSLVSGLLSKAWLELPTGWAVGIGVAVAIILGFLCKAGISHITFDEEKPKTSRRKLKLISYATFGASLILASIILMTRVPSGEYLRYMISIITISLGVSLGLLSVSLPILAGSLMAACHDYSWSFRYTKDFTETKMKYGDIKGLEEWIEDLLKKEEK